MAIAACAAVLPDQKKQFFKIARFTDAPNILYYYNTIVLQLPTVFSTVT